jgi:NADH-quinone oxidoreductase subunit M
MLGAAYMLRLGQKLAWGAPTEAARWRDLNVREWLYFAPLAVLVIYIGLAPGLTLRAMDPTLGRILADFSRPRAAATLPGAPAADIRAAALTPTPAAR